MNRPAFTLIELLVTLSLIAILSAIAISTLQAIYIHSLRAQTAGEIAALSTSLENYRTDTGAHPYGEGIDFPMADKDADPAGDAYLSGGRFLLRTLVGEKLGDNAYFTPESSQCSGDPYASDSYLIDPWGNAYGYSPAEPGAEDTPAFNIGFFDLWSTGGGMSADETDGWIVNWPDEVRRSVN